ncbi:MAG: CheR family methyltransferase [Elusimicrobiota bacterium]
MTDAAPKSLLGDLSQFMADRLGLNYPPERWKYLQDAIADAAVEFKFKDAESFIRWLLSSSPSKAQMETLAGCFTVGETYFFRQKQHFEALEERIIPEILRARKGEDRRLRIWSAGCCTGEEPYSIAIILDKFAAQLAGWHVSILATDVNEKFLRKAEEGVYGDWSFREVPQWVKDKYFRKAPQGKLAILPHLKEAVTFSALNLAEDVYPALLNGTNAMDVIFCRNVLMYFHPERAAEVVRRLRLCTAKQGWLFVSPSEVSETLFSRFEGIHYPDATLYRQSRDPYVESDMLPEKTEASPMAPCKDTLEVSARHGHIIESPGTAQYPQALIALARTRANQGRLDEALKFCDGALACGKLNASVHYLKGSILQEQGRVGEAAASFKRALYLDAGCVLAHFALGNLALRGRRLLQARRHFKNAAALLTAGGIEEILPDSGGLTAGRLRKIIASSLNRIGEST